VKKRRAGTLEKNGIQGEEGEQEESLKEFPEKWVLKPVKAEEKKSEESEFGVEAGFL